MRKRRIISLLTGIFMVLSISINVIADSCLDVRDYGYHRYAKRRVFLYNEVTELIYTYDNGDRLYDVVDCYWMECICGAQQIGYDSYTRLVPSNK